MKKQEEKIAKGLKTLIDSKGKDFLDEEPFEVYKILIENKELTTKMAGGILSVLVSGLHKYAYKEDFLTFSQIIQQECGFNKKTADSLALSFRLLYSKENCEEWKNRENEGLKQFIKDEFIYEWRGTSLWEESNGYISCYFNSTIVLQPLKEVAENKEIKQMLKDNPFMTTKAIHGYFAENLRGHLDSDFEYYCTCEDYPPVVEVYEINLEDTVVDWCRKNGFAFISCEGEGGDDGYEPNF